MGTAKSLRVASTAAIIAIQFFMLAGSVDAQDRTATLPAANTDPFRIGPGTTFSASVPEPVSPDVRRGRSAVDALINDLEEALKVIEQNFSGSVDRKSLFHSSLDTMLHSLDPHSNYLDPKEFSEFLRDQESDYSGTGSSIAGYERDGRKEIFIVSTHPNTAASTAGFRYGDRITAINGTELKDEDSLAVRDKVRGKRGTIVRITVERADTGTLETFALKRDRVPQPTVSSAFLLDGNVGYIELDGGFGYATAAEVDRAIADLKKRGMKSLVLDLRGNTGGLIDQAAKVAERFLPLGSLIFTQKGRVPGDERVWRSTNKNHETMPVSVLIDRNTASAAEIVAGAIQDNDRGLLIGEVTYGKGLVQNVIGLADGSGITLTTARYYTPSGRSVQREYDAGSNYDYYNHRDAPGESATTRTVTQRTVTVGKGITPDLSMAAARVSSEEMDLLDPIFYFVRDLMNSRNKTIAGPAAKNEIRQRIIFGLSPVTDEMLEAFFENASAANGSWKIDAAGLQARKEFIRKRLRYELGLAIFGLSGANKMRIEDDEKVVRAIQLLPESAKLAESAARVARK